MVAGLLASFKKITETSALCVRVVACVGVEKKERRFSFIQFALVLNNIQALCRLLYS